MDFVIAETKVCKDLLLRGIPDVPSHNRLVIPAYVYEQLDSIEQLIIDHFVSDHRLSRQATSIEERQFAIENATSSIGYENILALIIQMQNKQRIIIASEFWEVATIEEFKAPIYYKHPKELEQILADDYNRYRFLYDGIIAVLSQMQKINKVSPSVKIRIKKGPPSVNLIYSGLLPLLMVLSEHFHLREKDSYDHSDLTVDDNWDFAHSFKPHSFDALYEVFTPFDSNSLHYLLALKVASLFIAHFGHLIYSGSKYYYLLRRKLDRLDHDKRLMLIPDNCQAHPDRAQQLFMLLSKAAEGCSPPVLSYYSAA